MDQLARARDRPPRVLVATCLAETLWPHLAVWEHGLRQQETELLWDVVVVDGTDFPSPEYASRLRGWAGSRPFGQGHRVRLLHVGLEAEGRMFVHPGWKLARARELLWEKFATWTSYDHLLNVALDVGMPPDALQRLYQSGQPWAVAWTPDAIPNPLRCSLLRGELARCLPFNAALESDLGYGRACADQGVYPALVPVT